MNKYFYLENNPIYQDKYLIRFNHDTFLFPKGTSGSYDVFISRLLNLSYADYLKYVRDRLGAELIGKNNRYITVLFNNNNNVKAFINLLNKRLEYIINERDFPYEYKEDNGIVKRIPFNKNEDNN